MSNKLRAGQKIKLKSVEELLGVSNEESAMDIEIAKIRSFKNHPFKVVDDEKMQDLVESMMTGNTSMSISPLIPFPVWTEESSIPPRATGKDGSSRSRMPCVKDTAFRN